MRSFISRATALLALGCAVAAQDYYNQSAPFYLVLSGSNSSYDNQALEPCHEGAGFEALCPAGAQSVNSSTFNFNFTSYQDSDGLYGGILTYELRGGNFNESQPLGFIYNAGTNVAIPMFTPGDADTQYVAFDPKGLLTVPDYVSDTVTPPVAGKEHLLYNWHICNTNYDGYSYFTLSWVVGIAEPQNPSCIKTNVSQVFVA